MRPTRLGVLLAALVVAGVLGYLLPALAYGSLPPLPSYAALSLVLLALAELAMAKAVHDRVRRRRAVAGRRALHPLQVARAAALAKASSPTGAALAGVYGGWFAWVAPRRDELVFAAGDAVAAGLSTLAALALVGAALLLERACRTPPQDDEQHPLGFPP